MADIRMFSAKPYELDVFEPACTGGPHRLCPTEARLSVQTVGLAAGAEAVCVFVNDELVTAVIEALANGGTRCIALRCAGFNNVDIEAARAHGVSVVRVPAYSPNAIAEHTIALILSLNRRIHRAYNRVRDGNFALDGLVGFDLAGKTAATKSSTTMSSLACSPSPMCSSPRTRPS